jgi:hypothetical protein
LDFLSGDDGESNRRFLAHKTRRTIP